MAAPATPAAMGSMLLLAETGQPSETTDNDRRPVTTTPPRRTVTSGRKPRKTAAPHLPGLLIGSDRALE